MIEQQKTNAPVAAPPAAPPAQPPTTTDDLASLLSEFESATAKPPEAQQHTSKPGEVAPAQVANHDSFDAQLAKLSSDLNSDAMRAQLGTVTSAVQSLYQHQQIMQDHNDFESIVSRADKLLTEAGHHVGADYARRWILAESLTDPQLRAAFDARYQSPQHQRLAERMVNKALERLLRSAKAQPDQDATATRMSVAAAVRGASTRPPPEKPVRYGDLTDAEFAAEKRKYGL